MKKIILAITTVLLLSLGACADYLDIVPDNTATMDHAFSDRVSAERFLSTLYSYMPQIGNPRCDPALLSSDEYGVVENAYDMGTFYYYGNKIKFGQQNTNDPLFNYWEGRNEGRGLFIALRDCNIFLDNIDNVGPDLSNQEKIRWIAEAKFFKAFYHFYLMRLYGPIPLIKENAPIDATTEQLKVYRAPFDDGIAYITELCDEAMPDLPLSISNVGVENGRITRPIAAMLKAEALVLAASPLFNGNPDFKMLVDNRGIQLCSVTEDRSKWKTAADACKIAVDMALEAGLDLYKFEDSRFSLSDETRLSMTVRGVVTEKWNKELIWGNAVNTPSSLQNKTIPYFVTSSDKSDPSIYANFKMAELYYSNNGVPIEEDVDYNYSGRYETVTVGSDHFYYIKQGSVTAGLNTYREPRFYGSLGFDTNYWYGNGRTIDVGGTPSNQTPWIIKAKGGEVSGKSSDIRYSRSGYFIKKVSNFETGTVDVSQIAETRYTFPIMRLADLYLLYAEALNESLDAPNGEVYDYVDRVRERAGLDGVVESWENHSKIPNKPATKEGMREIIRRERMIELAFEGKRFWDLRRWRVAHTYFNEYERGWNVNQKTTDDYYNVVSYNQIQYTVKNYLWPIRDSELRKNSNLIQNPYWGY